MDRPANSNPADVTLYAYDPAAKKIVFAQPAGTWPNVAGAHNNTVPAVANGQVFVASYQQLTIWGLTPPSTVVTLSRPVFANPVQLKPGEHDIFGTIAAMSGTSITLKRRDGTTSRVTTIGAAGARLALGEAVRVVGSGTQNALNAKWVARAQSAAAAWPPDR